MIVVDENPVNKFKDQPAATDECRQGFDDPSPSELAIEGMGIIFRPLFRRGLPLFKLHIIPLSASEFISNKITLCQIGEICFEFVFRIRKREEAPNWSIFPEETGLLKKE